jgi:dienelactone hydrolase
VTELAGWARGSFTSEGTDGGTTYPTYRRGSGPGVVVVHEVPGITPAVRGFAEEVVDAGFTVVMPSLFGRPGGPKTLGPTLRTLARVCVSREFATLAAGTTSPIATWLRALARELHEELGGPGVGALGMCFSGGFALAMMVEEHTVAPVLSQPSMPFPVTKRLAADLNLSPEDLAAVRARTDCPVLGLRYRGDKAVGTRFDTLRAELGDRFRAVEFDGRKHSVLTDHRQDEGVAAVLAFFRERLLVP